MNIQTAAAQLKTTFKKVAHTKAVATENSATLFHYDTPIVAIFDQYITINNGGFTTVTTKKFINRALQAIGAKASVSQRKGVWYLDANGSESTITRSISFAA